MIANNTKPTFFASSVAPDPTSNTYWIDINEDPNGSIIKYWDGVEWIILDQWIINYLMSELEKAINMLKDGTPDLSGDNQGNHLEAGYDNLLKMQLKLKFIFDTMNIGGEDVDKIINTLQEVFDYLLGNAADPYGLVKNYSKYENVSKYLEGTDEDAVEAVTYPFNPEFNPNDWQETVKPLFDIYGNPVYKRTKDGNYEYDIDGNKIQQVYSEWLYVGTHPLEKKIASAYAVNQLFDKYKNLRIEFDEAKYKIKNNPGDPIGWFLYNKFIITTGTPNGLRLSTIYNTPDYGDVMSLSVDYANEDLIGTVKLIDTKYLSDLYTTSSQLPFNLATTPHWVAAWNAKYDQDLLSNRFIVDDVITKTVDLSVELQPKITVGAKTATDIQRGVVKLADAAGNATVADGYAVTPYALYLEALERQSGYEQLSDEIAALQGAYMYRGRIDLHTPAVTQQALTDRLVEIMGRQPKLGDVLIDLDGNDWYFNGVEWENMGPTEIGSYKSYNLTAQIDGVTTKFVLPEAVYVITGVFLNGQKLVKDLNYTVLGYTMIQLNTSVPLIGDTLVVETNLSDGGQNPIREYYNITLPVSNWVNNDQVVTLPLIWANTQMDMGLPTPTTRENADALANSQIIITGLTSSTVTFSCSVKPLIDINLVIRY